MSTSKMKFRFKLTGLEIEMEGTREEVGHAATAFTDQLTNMLKPKALNEFQSELENNSQITPHTEVAQIQTSTPKKKKTTRAKSNANATAKTVSLEAIDTKFDSGKYGVPKQAWKGIDKALWIMYVLKEETGLSEIASTQIANTFNKHFKQSGPLNRGNVPRDLGLKKMATPSLVGEDASHVPSKWFLTDAGIQTVQDIIIAQKGEK